MPPFPGVDVVRLLQEGMRTAALNHRLIANNIANADTPDYNPVHLDFQSALRAALEGSDRVSLRKTQVRHLNAARPLLKFERLAILSKNDYNKVDLDEEMVRLSDNTSKYTIYSALLAKHFRMTRNMLTTLR